MRSITSQDATADAAIETAIATMLSTWHTTKTSDLGAVLDRGKAVRILVRRMLAKDRRGASKLRSTD